MRNYTMIRTNLLSWLLRNLYKDYSISFQTEHPRKIGIEAKQRHVLIVRCTIKGHDTGIYLHTANASLIQDCLIYGHGTTLENPFIAEFATFWRSLKRKNK